MFPISRKHDAWASEAKGDLLDHLISRLPSLTKVQGKRRYPVISAIRANGADLFFLRYFEEKAEDTSSTFRAIIEAYAADEVVLSYLVGTDFCFAEKPPYVLLFKAIKGESLLLKIGKQVWDNDHFKIQKIIGQMNEGVEKVDFLFNEVLYEFYMSKNDRTSEARLSLESWRPDINWAFVQVMRGELPESKAAKVVRKNGCPLILHLDYDTG